MKILLPTSTAGSLPKPSWLAQPEKLWSPWKLDDEILIEGKKMLCVYPLMISCGPVLISSVMANKPVSTS